MTRDRYVWLLVLAIPLESTFLSGSPVLRYAMILTGSIGMFLVIWGIWVNGGVDISRYGIWSHIAVVLISISVVGLVDVTARAIAG